MTYKLESNSPEATSEIGSKFASKLQGNETIVLIGDLGAGKTQFVRGIASGLGSKDVVQSPTFTLSREYQLPNGKELHHYDFYRLGEAGIVGQEFEESIDNPDTIVVVEWADIVNDVLPVDVISIHIQPISENARHITSTLELE